MAPHSHFIDLAQPLFQRLADCVSTPRVSLSVFGLTPEQIAFIFLKSKHRLRAEQIGIHTWVCRSNDEAEQIYDLLQGQNLQSTNIMFYPGLEANPYHNLIASERNLIERFKVLDILSQGPLNETYIITSIDALFLKQPPAEFFKQNRFKISTSDIISPDELAAKLVGLGFVGSTTVEEPGSFARKGEIFDLYGLESGPVRIHYFDDMVEEIFLIDPETQKTKRDRPLDGVEVGPFPAIFAKSEFTHFLRENIPMPKPQFKKKFEERKRVFNSLASGHLFDGYAHLAPYFFANSECLLEQLARQKYFLTFLDTRDSKHYYTELMEELRSDFEAHQNDIESESILPGPSTLYVENAFELVSSGPHAQFDLLNIEVFNEDEESLNTISLNIETPGAYFTRFFSPNLKRSEFVFHAFETLKIEFKYSGLICFVYKHESSRREIESLVERHEFPPSLKERIHYLYFPLEEGFYYDSQKVIVLTEANLFTKKQDKVKAKKLPAVDLFAEQLATLKKGDFVIHTHHGLGEYLGLETMDFGGAPSDYLVLNYADNDKVYVPVYKLNLIQKHAEQSSGLKPESLRTNKFQLVKARAKTSAKKLAFDLLKLQAERQSTEAFAFNPPDDYYLEFEKDFRFEETPDQQQAIENVLEEMQKSQPMDHLVCGDVGFGKTEVAMRAAFKAVLDKKQVAVLVPTTILAFQHYNSFIERFKKFPVKIDFISRFKSAKESNEIKAKLKAGEIDILIGTHKILSDKLEFFDLGLVIVDEEQRFGVGHKEKLKLLKATVDFLTLTATPIPRTLQLAFLGLRDMSLIQTPPPKRQSIKSYIIKEDDLTIQAALKKEIARGGQAFIVHNRVHDIEDYAGYIRDLVPEASIVFAHGQMAERELENRMKDFYNGKYQILISTTIIESGIDIPNANTMIVDRADNYGLSQLHQLRGRIGRSEKKAYAYFVVPKSKMLTPVAEKRLKALQTYADIGSGFNIATSDLEIRGAGDILGADQSGHVEAIGLELYMELLKEAIHEIKGEKRIVKKDVEITAPHPAYIPNNYISDSSLRLKTYKRLSNCSTTDELYQIQSELTDIYGQTPSELQNLFLLLETRLAVQQLGLKSIQIAGRVIILNFEKSYLEADEALRNKVVEVFLSRPKVYQFSPDFKVTFHHKEEVNLSFLVEFAKDIAQQIVPC